MKRSIAVLLFCFAFVFVACDGDSIPAPSTNPPTDNSNSNGGPDNAGSGSDNSDTGEPLASDEHGYITITLTARDATTVPQTIQKTFDKGMQGDVSEYFGPGVITTGEPLVIKVESPTKFIDTSYITATTEVYHPDDMYYPDMLGMFFPNIPNGAKTTTVGADDFLSQDRASRVFYMSGNLEYGSDLIRFNCPNLHLLNYPQQLTYEVTISDLQIGTHSFSGTIEMVDVEVFSSPADRSSDQVLLGTYDIVAEFKLRKLLDVPAYVVSYDGNDSTGGTGPVFSLNLLNGGQISNNGGTYSTSDPFVKTGKIFTGWNTGADGTGILYNPGEWYTDQEDVQLYAQWENPFPIESTSDGNIFYENPNYATDGWRYLELSNSAIPAVRIPWSNVSNSLVGTSSNIGVGDANSLAIIRQSGHTDSAAKQCLEFDGGDKGWYLPSSGELAQAAYHLKAWDEDYLFRSWSSTEESSSRAYIYATDWGLQREDKVDTDDYPSYSEIYPMRKLDSDKEPIAVDWQ